jgi:Asp-tRNA(Asn)/Glu-tRNA(Gln) amidotransferase A subunit family amidase
MDVCELSAAGLADHLHRRELSAGEALTAVLERCDRLEGALNPFSVRLDARARWAAEQADAVLARGEGGPLTGLPITVKDSHWMAGIESAHGSLAMAGHVPTETCAAIERLEAAGAVIFAKTTTPEFCYSGITASPLHGVTRNPWNPDRTCGGSSGGSAVAVAAGLGPLSLGGDGGGSIRIPAAFCGIVGFKPTFGLVPREPCADGWKSLVSIGPMARSVADVRLMLSPIAGIHQRDRHSIPALALDVPTPDLRGMRFAVSEDLGQAPVDDDVLSAFRAALDRLVESGAEIVHDHPGLDTSVWTWATIAAADARWSEAHAWEHSRHVLTERTREMLTFGEQVTADEYVLAQYRRERIHRAYVDLFERIGACALLTPTLGCEAFGHDAYHPGTIGGVDVGPPWLDWAGFLYDANLGGFPACALPIGLGDAGLPLSMQVLGLRGWDGPVLAVAAAIEAVVDFKRVAGPAPHARAEG